MSADFDTAICYNCGTRIRIGERHNCSSQTYLKGTPGSIIADTREKLPHPYPSQTLPQGDYLITTTAELTILIERKSWADLAGSFASQRLQQQLWRMAREQPADRLVLIIEESYVPRRVFQLLKSALHYVTSRVEPLLYVAYTGSYEETLELLEYWRKNGDTIFYAHRPVPKAHRTQDMLMAIPGIGEKTRDKIVRSGRFKSFADFVKRVGKLKGVLSKTAVDTIADFLNEEW